MLKVLYQKHKIITYRQNIQSKMLRLRRRPSQIAVSNHHNRKVGEKFLTGLKSLEAKKTNVTMKPGVEFTNSNHIPGYEYKMFLN